MADCKECLHNGVCYLQEVSVDIERVLKDFGCDDYKPTADAVEVTRCADCQHCALEYTDQGFGYPSRPTRVCIIHDHETKLDDYCSWAKRKDD